MHTTGAPAVPEAVKTELFEFYQNDTIIALFFTGNKNKDDAEVVNLTNTGVDLTKKCMFCSK